MKIDTEFRDAGAAVVVASDVIRCPYGNDESLHSPACRGKGNCLIQEESCVLQVPREAVLTAAEAVLKDVLPHPLSRLAGSPA